MVHFTIGVRRQSQLNNMKLWIVRITSPPYAWVLLVRLVPSPVSLQQKIHILSANGKFCSAWLAKKNKKTWHQPHELIATWDTIFVALVCHVLSKCKCICTIAVVAPTTFCHMHTLQSLHGFSNPIDLFSTNAYTQSIKMPMEHEWSFWFALESSHMARNR